MYLWKASLFRTTTNTGKCIVAIVEDLLAPKIINTLVPLLFALRDVSNSAINSGSTTKLIFLQKWLSLPLILGAYKWCHYRYFSKGKWGCFHEKYSLSKHFFCHSTTATIDPSCSLFSSLTHSSCHFAIAVVSEDITASLMKRYRCCELNLLTLL